jgi:crotonobetainyl-CoA:carnitine CoA-transferase CaiB-like acyl-CoA transferase
MFALDGIRVIDFGQYLAGPFGPMILGDMGADVVKVEPTTGDGMRFSFKPFVGCQRGKRSLALDLKSEAGLEIALQLVAGADVVHHNMTRGVATRLGIDYDACRAVNPTVIYCNTYAYGLPDPLGHFGGLDPLYQASAGLEYEAGATHTGNPPLYLRFGMTDTSNALLSVVGVLLALFHRDRTGEGQQLWTSLHDGGLIFSSDIWLDGDGRPWDRPRLDAGQYGLGPYYRVYETSDGWITVAALHEEHREALRGCAGPEPFDEQFAADTTAAWVDRLSQAGVPHEVPVDPEAGAAVFRDEANRRLGLVTSYEHPTLGLLEQFGELIGFSDTPGRIAGPPPLVGQHSREVLREIGLDEGAIDGLVAAGVVAHPAWSR